MLADSNIIIYAINISSPKHKVAQNFIKENAGKLAVAHQNIFEALRVLTHPRLPNPMKPDEAIRAVETIATMVRVVVAPDDKTHHLALALIKKHSLVAEQIFDAYLAATALANGIDTIATDNISDFEKFTSVKVFNPFC